MRKSLLAAVFLWVVPCGLALAGVAPVGSEFAVSSYTTSDREEPIVGLADDGSFVVIWESNGQDGSGVGLFGRRFDSTGRALGVEFLVNSYTTSGQGNASIAMGAGDEFMVVWSSFGGDGSSVGVSAQRFDSQGFPLGGEFIVNAYTTGNQTTPSVGTDDGSTFTVAWMDFSGQDGNQSGIFAQRLDSSGAPLGGQFQVNTYTTSYQTGPAVGMSGDGTFVVTWTSSGQDGSGSGVFGQRFDSTGAPAGGEFQVNSYTTGSQSSPVVGMDMDGGFVVVWLAGGGQDGDGSGIFGQMFDSAGAQLGGEFQVNTYTTSDQWRASIAMTPMGEFMVVWINGESHGQPVALDGIHGQRFSSTGAFLGGEFQVNSHPSMYTYSSAIDMSEGGEFVVAWHAYQAGDGSYGALARRGFDRGPAMTDPVLAGTVDCSDPALVRPTITWEQGDYDQFKVFAGSSPGFEKGTRVTSGNRKITTGSWFPSKKQWKKACTKALDQAVDPNNPVMYIRVLGKDRDLSKKDPLRKIYSFAVPATVVP